MSEQVEQFDLKETFLANIFWLMYMSILILFMIKLMSLLNNFNDETTKLLATLIICFVIIKLIGYIDAPKFVFKTQTGKIVY